MNTDEKNYAFKRGNKNDIVNVALLPSTLIDIKNNQAGFVHVKCEQ